MRDFVQRRQRAQGMTVRGRPSGALGGRGRGYSAPLRAAIVAYVRARRDRQLAFAVIARRIGVRVATFWPWLHETE